jgi:hypothetical protein
MLSRSLRVSERIGQAEDAQMRRELIEAGLLDPMAGGM